jgi:serine/threonine protein kinase
MDPREAARMVEKLARTLAFAHRWGVVHRDVKPGNIMIDGSGEPRLTDFGLAKAIGHVGSDLTSTGQVLGTPAYMAPEQARGSNRLVGPLADVYALGATFFEMLTGAPPFLGFTPLETLRAVSDDDPPLPSSLRPGLDSALDAVVLTCLAKAPDDRYPSSEALAMDLRRFLDGAAVVATVPSAEERVERSIRSKMGLVVRAPETFLAGFDPAYADHAERLLERFSGLLREISVSIVNDGRIDAEETRAIRGEWERLKAYTEAFVSGCEEGVFATLDDDGDEDDGDDEHPTLSATPDSHDPFGP